MNRFRIALTYCAIVGIACICALNYELFIFPNQFAPAGVNGICTMIQHIFGVSMGYLSLLVNIPLALVLYFKVSKPLAVRSIVYVATFSIMLIVLDYVDLSRFSYDTANGTSTVLGPLVAGVIFGSCYNWLLKAGAYSGGTDFVASLLHKNNPERSVIGMTFVLNACVAVLSYFVYDYQIEPVILCILYSYTSSTISNYAVKNDRSAIRFEIITDDPDTLSQEIIRKLHHSVTLIPAKGMFKGKQTNLLICVVNRTQQAALSAIVRSHPNTFAVMSQVSEVMGNFKHLDTRGKLKKNVLDQGDTSPV